MCGFSGVGVLVGFVVSVVGWVLVCHCVRGCISVVFVVCVCGMLNVD